jgi:uncharacterized membrane protein YozB (DUF420 family)
LDLSLLPAVNAGLNLIATSLLVVGRRLVKQGRIDAHKRVMLAAFGVSTLFLVFYVAHKVSRSFENTTFQVEGIAKTAYLLLLFSHVTLAAAVPVLAILLIRFGLRHELERHRRLARIAWPIWMYVSVTGVLIYLLLYHLNPDT